MAPKALLRKPECTSSLGELAAGSFGEVLTDPTVKQARRVIFCSGRVYYDLLSARKTSDVALIRIEQLYPLEDEKIKNVIKSYAGASEWCWVQEEPRNMGAWSYIFPLLNQLTPKAVRYAGREASSSPAAGSHVLHKEQFAKFIQEALFQ